MLKKIAKNIFFFPLGHLHCRSYHKNSDYKKKQIIVYPGTRVHESEKKIFLCVAQGVEVGRHKKNFFLGGGNFFQHVKKLINFENFVKVKVAKFKLNHLG